MRSIYSLLLLTALNLPFNLFSQNCPPPGFPQSGNNCGNPIICENLDGYCNEINNNNQSRAFPCCPGWTLNNDEWFGFFAGTTTITIEVTPSNCNGNQPGLQGAIYDNCPPSNPSNAWCDANEMDSQCACTEDPFTLSSTNFVVGEVYWIVFDGCGGSVCDYEVQVLEGSTVGFAPDDPGPVTGPTPVCQGTTTDYELPPVNGATTYTWTLTPSNAGTIQGNDDDISVAWAAGFSGTATLCVSTSNLCYSNPIQSCITVDVIPKPTASISGSAVICANSGGSVDIPVTLTGDPDWRLVYSINGVDQPPVIISSSPYVITLSQPGTVTLVSVLSIDSSPACAGTVSGSVTVTEVTLSPTATTVAAVCGQSNGSVDLSISGGNSPYTYAWSGGETTQDLSGMPPGTYTVTVTDNNGCTGTQTATVSDNITNPNLTAAITNNTSCLSGNGAIDLSVTPAGSYTYNWSNGATSQDLTNLTPGDYTVTVTQGITCSAVSTFTVADNPNNPTATATPTNTSCDLGNGSINGGASGGVAPYTYSWSNGATTEDLANIPAGNYILTVTGANGCTNTISVDVTNINPPLNLSATTVANTTCNGGNGSIDLTATPAGNYTYNWSGGQTTQDLSNLPPGNYTVTVSNGGSCTAEATYTVADNPNLPNPTAVPTQSTCDLPNGSINGGASGGVAPYTYSWSNGATTEDLANVLAGNYILTVTGANGCTNTISVDVANNNPPINLSATIVANTTCNGGNGSIDLSATPAGNYTYNWSNGSTSQDLSNLPPGNYTVTVSAGGSCTNEATYNVPDNPNLPNPTAVPTQTSCDFSNGSINASVSGGVAPYTFNWSNGATTEDLANIPPGNYSLTVTGANGCTNVIDVNVTNNNPPITVTATTMPNTVCNAAPNGSIDVSVNPPGSYTYTWSTGATSQDLSGLAPGSYTITVSAGGSCTQEATFEVPTNPNEPMVTSTVVNTSCDFPNGSINTFVTGGPTPYTFQWSNGATTQNLNNLLAGDYSVTVTSPNGCTGVANITVANVNPPINLSANILGNTSCNSSTTGSVDLSVSPAGNYTYTWSNGSTSQDLTNLPQGDYQVTVSAGGSCTEVASFNVPFVPNEPTLSSVTISARCGLPNGSINLSVFNGVLPYTYIWSSGQTVQDLNNIPGGDYAVTVTGANGCTAVENINVPNDDIPVDIDATVNGKTSCIINNGSINLQISPFNATILWSTGSTALNLVGLAPGDYTVTVSAGGTCTASATYTIEDISELPILSADVIPAVCSFTNGEIDLNVDFGIPPYTYDWQHIPGPSNVQDLMNLPAGNYVVTVTTSVGCTEVLFVPIDNEPIQIQINGVVFDDYSCTSNNGFLDINVDPPVNYIYDWAHIPGTNNIQNLINLGAGSFTVTVTYGSCNANASFDVLDATAPPSVSISATAAICGQTNGAVTLSVGGATPPYTYNWAHIPGLNNPQNLSNLAPGTYTVTVTDFFDCTATASATVVNNTIAVNISGIPAANTSCAAPNGGLDITVSPAATYTYLWSNAATTEDLTGIAPGIYSVTASAGVGCAASATFIVGNNTVDPQLGADVIAAICSQNNGNIDITTGGGTAPFSFIWSNGATTEDLSGIFPGNYALTVTDANGCTADTTLNVANNASTFSLSGTATPYGDCATVNGAVDLTVTPAGPYTYLWSTGATTQDLSGMPAGTYTVEVTEQGTCIASATYFVLDTRTYPTLNQGIVAELCNLSDGSIDLSVLGGLAPFTYTWDSGETTEDLINVGGGTYNVTVSGANNCSATATLLIPENDLSFALSGAATPNSSCVVLNGAIDLDINPAVPSGGPGYSYTWSNGLLVQDLNGIPAGNYTVTVSAGGTCTNTATFNVADDAGAPSLSEGVTPALCGQSNGSVNISISGGAAPFGYIWSTGATTEDLGNIPSGNYAVTVTGSNGCQITDNVAVPEDVVTPTLSGIPQPNTACVGPNGSINLSISPATLTYTIIWSNGSTTQNLSNLTAGTYTVVVNGGGACTSSATYVVANNSQGVTATGTDLDVLCFGNNTGAIDLVLSGGTQPFVFNWSPNLGNIEDPGSLTAGTYAVTVTDAVGCSATASFNISQPAAAVQAVCTALNLASQPGAADGSAQVQISGGVAPYNILWSPGGTQSGLAAGIFPLNNLSSGNYNVTVTDANGCTAICGFTILVTPCETAIGTMGDNSLSLCGTGCITANYDALGQILDPNDILQFILHQGSGDTIINEIARSSQPTFCFNPAKMSYGTTYYISAVAGNNNGTGNVVLAHYCTVIATGTPVVFYEKPVASAALPEPITCKTLQVSVLGSSNLPNSTFQWSTTNGNIIGNPIQANIEVNDAGNYTVIVTSPEGCLDTTFAEVLDIRNDPVAQILASPDDILDCVIDEIILAGEVKGSGDANSIWYDQNGVTYPGGTVLQINVPGTYWFAIVDTVTFCTDTASIVIGENQIYPPLFINPPSILTCSIGSVTLSGGSPIGGINFTWATINGQDTTLVGTGMNVNVTQPGTYFLLGVDPVNGCDNILSVVVTADQTYPNASAGPPFNIDCFGETALLSGSATGGTGTLNYSWTTVGGAILSGANTLNPTISEPGTYTLLVTATGNGCSDTDVVVIAPNEPVAIPIIDSPACVGEKGSILIDTVLGAKPPLMYTLTGGTYIQSGGLFSNLAPGDYTIVIEDANGCTTSVDGTVIQPPVFEVTVEPQVTVLLGDSYQVDATVNVPESEIAQITWTPPTWLSCDTCLSTRIDTPLQSQNYRILVITKEGCRDDAQFLLRVNRQVKVYIPNIFSPNDDGENDGFTVYADMKGVKQVKLFQIYSRWGEQVFVRENFQPNDPTLGWNGRFRGQDMNPAVFVYYAIVEFIDGQEVLYKGDVTVKR